MIIEIFELFHWLQCVPTLLLLFHDYVTSIYFDAESYTTL